MPPTAKSSVCFHRFSAQNFWRNILHRLVMNSSNVEVQVTAVNANINDDNLKHYVEVFVGPARTQGYSAA